MTTGPVAGVREFIYKTFPRRQFYHRSNGIVHYTELGPWTQLCMTLLSLTFLGWVAYASVNVVFKDQIIAAKDARFRSMQQLYEGRMSEMQLDYDELNGLLAMAEQRFQAKTDELESKYRQLFALAAQRDSIRLARAEIESKVETLAGMDEFLPAVPQKMVAEIEAREAKEAEATANNFIGGELLESAAALSRPAETSLPSDDPLVRAGRNNRIIQNMVGSENKVMSLAQMSVERMEDWSRGSESEIAELESIIAMSGLSADDIAGPRQMAMAAPLKVAAASAMSESAQGGPLFSLIDQTKASATPDDPYFDLLVLAVSSQLDRLSILQDAVSAMPIVLPMRDATRLSSGFGPRRDPFTKRWAFHSGLDFSAEYGNNVLATAPGTVTYAGPRGPYGNMVEVDHGAGFRTRYAHLKRINVELGDKIAFQQVVGFVGSTGRSTGPHLHYEIWYDGKVRDPRNFLRAGRYVFQK